MKKNIFYWAFFVLAGMSLTACSSGDDNIADNTTPATPGSQNKTVILTGTIGVGGDETRAVDKDGKTSWTPGDKIAIIYESTSTAYSTAQGEIKSVSSDGHYATFEADLTNPKDNGNIGFAYPYDKVAMDYSTEGVYGFTFDYSYYTNQVGTPKGITDSGLDYACTVNGEAVMMAVDGGKAKLKSTAKLRNQFSMYEFTLKTDEATPQNAPAKKLEIWVGESTFSSTPKYTITPANSAAYSTFYVALEPTLSTVDKVKIVASFDGQDPAIKLDTDAKVNAIDDDDYGKFLCVDETVNKTTSEKDHQAYLCATTGSAYFCEHTYRDSKFVKGKLYTKELEVKKLTPTAVIAYTGAVTNYCDNFIALALSDATDGTNVVTLGQGQAKVNDWLANDSNPRTLKIANTTCPASLSGTQGKYDDVKANPQKSEGTKYFNADNPNAIVSNESATSMQQGWRLPTVTDFRRIFSQLKDNNGNPVMTGITATNPSGIMDHNGVYGYYTGTYGSGGFWTYPYKDAYDNPLSNYYRGSSPLLTYINHLLGTYTMDSQYYWLGSGVIEENQSTASTDKGWRYSFNNDYFIWNAAGITDGDKAFIRLVFAY